MNYGQSIMAAQQGQVFIGGGGMVLKDPMPITPMQEARNGLADSVGRLHAALDDLSRRLESTCTPEPPNAGNQASAPVPLTSELRSFLHSQTSGVDHAIMRIASILQRIEL